MSWPRAAQPTELAAWRRRREQDVRDDDPEAGWPATPQRRSAPPQEPGSPWPDSPPLGRSGSAAVHLRGPRFSEHREQLGLD